MTCKGPLNDYLDYKCYYTLNDRFISRNLDFTEAVRKFSDTYKTPETKNSSLLKDILPKLKKYLSDDHSFSSYDHLHICKYISYLLYDEICKNDYNVCDKDIFNILKNFVKLFHEHSRYDKCASKIDYLDHSTYKKHNILYDLYDKYSILIGNKTSKPYIPPCKILDSLIFYYNDAISSHGESDINFIDKLIELKKLIKANVLPSKTNCKRFITDFKETDIEKTRAKELAEAQKRLQEEEGAREQKRLLEAAEAEQKRQLQAAAEAARRQQVNTDEALERERRVVKPEDGITLVQQTPYGESEAHRISPLAERFTPTHTIEGPLDAQFYGQENTRVTLPGDQEGILDKMKSSISGIGEYVEPVPLMGVSGGMGALFLLFRYTPVGTFFRGRRGRTYGIPSGFSGPLPGEFPGYQDYLGANIGYSPMNPLAE